MMIVAIRALMMIGLGSAIYYFLREASDVVAVRAMDPTDTQAAALQRELLRTDRMTLIALVASGVLLVVVIAAGGLALTRKIAEPLFKVAFHMNEIAIGRLSPIRPYGLAISCATSSRRFRRCTRRWASARTPSSRR